MFVRSIKTHPSHFEIYFEYISCSLQLPCHAVECHSLLNSGSWTRRRLHPLLGTSEGEKAFPCPWFLGARVLNTDVSMSILTFTQDSISSPHPSPFLFITCSPCSLTSGPLAALHILWNLTEKREKQNTEASGLCYLGHPAIKRKKKILKISKFFPQQHASLRDAYESLATESVCNSFRPWLAIRVFPFGEQFSPCP